MFSTRKQSIPDLFLEIMRNYGERMKLKELSIIPWEAVQTYRKLQREMAEYRRGAEEILHWNKDKGREKK